MRVRYAMWVQVRVRLSGAGACAVQNNERGAGAVIRTESAGAVKKIMVRRVRCQFDFWYGCGFSKVRVRF